KMTRILLSLVFLLSFGTTIAQKRAISHEDYDLWKTITKTEISTNGNVVATTVQTSTRRGDGYLQIYNAKTKEKTIFFNGEKSAITYDEKFIIFQKKPKYATKRQERKDKVKEANKEKDVLYIYDVANNMLYDSIDRVKSYKLPQKNSSYLVIEKFKNKKDSIKSDSLPAWKHNYALVYNLQQKTQDTIYGIKNLAVSKEGTTFYYTTKSKKNKKKAHGVYAYDTKAVSRKVIDTSGFDYKKLTVNALGNQVAFIVDSDSVQTDSVPYKLYLYKDNVLKQLLGDETTYLGKNETLSDTEQLLFSEDNKRLYFNSKLKSTYEKDTTLLDDEIPDVDVWNWQDAQIQPRQEANKKRYKEDNRLYAYNVQNGRYIKLQDDQLDEITLSDKYIKKYTFGLDYSPYAVETWESPWKRDVYVVNVDTGKKRLLLKKTASRVDLSHDGKYGIYFDFDTYDWFSVNLETLQRVNLTKDTKVSFEREEHDTPARAKPYYSGGMDKDGDLLLYDKYDIWKVPLDGSSKPKNITRKGRRKKITFRTLRQKEMFWLAQYVDDKLVLTGFDEKIKANGIYLLDDGKLIEKVTPKGHKIKNLQKADAADVFTFSMENVKECPDTYITTDKFATISKFTNVNPQQNDFKWGTAELVSWKAYDGTKLEGIVHKPENFDPSKKYPLIVYFYERNANELNSYNIPRPSASTVSKAYAVSNDYIVFTPDIVYKTGQPGEDAYNCIISGVEMMEKKSYIDSSRMALQGQSWGGYQVAYLITRTNKFRAAMAGAPVSNMTSAYGGIRWQSGMSRMFQYEQTQSRIGKNLWEGFDLYVKNSPLFSVPSVETPLLIMHNDKDGAVPYYQGIELFMGMRRLKKPVWMLVYNNEAHNLRKVKNKQDLSIRMMQFFDHYLKEAPAPVWMTKGVPRSQKGKNLGYELDKQ
ncbi:MAG: prolyl oligopeptidase family serine peptidase, partial [Bacteroidota bacterium]